MPSLLRLLARLVTTGPYYVQIQRNRLTVRNASGGYRFDDEPIVAIANSSGRPKVLGVGSAARSIPGDHVNPFSHARVLIADFTLAEELLIVAFKTVAGTSVIRPHPIVVIHVKEPLAGGLTGIERRALHEMAQGAGARETFLWEGAELSDEDLKSGIYKSAI